MENSSNKNLIMDRKPKIAKVLSFLSPALMYALCSFIFFILLNLLLYNQANVHFIEQHKACKTAESIQEQFLETISSFNESNSFLHKIITAAHTNEIEYNLYDLVSLSMSNSHLRLYSVVIFDKYYNPIVWWNKPKTILFPASLIHTIGNTPQLLSYRNSTLLLSSKDLPSNRIMIFELVLQQLVPIENKYLTNYQFTHLNERASVLFDPIQIKKLTSTSPKDLEITKGKESYHKYLYPLLDSSQKAIGIITISGNTYSATKERILFTYSLLNLIFIGILIIYYIIMLMRNIHENTRSALIHYAIILALMWGYRILWLSIDIKKLKEHISLFDHEQFALNGYGDLFSSPADFLFTSIIITIQIILLFSIFRVHFTIHSPHPRKNNLLWAYLFILIGSLSILFSCLAYTYFLKNILFNSSINLTNYFLPELDSTTIAMQCSLHLLELSMFLLFLTLFLTMVRMVYCYDLNKVICIVLVLAPLIIHHFLSYLYVGKIPNRGFIILYLFLLFVAIIFSIIKVSLDKSVLRKAFLGLMAIILLHSICYYIRSNIYQNIKRDFLLSNAVSMIKDQEKWTANIFSEVLNYIDRKENASEAEHSSLMAKNVFKLWTETSFPVYGINSGIEFYDEDLRILDKFSYGIKPYPFFDLFKNTDPDLYANKWLVEEENAYESEKEKRILLGIKHLTSSASHFIIVVYAELAYDNLPFNTAKNPYDELLLSSIKASGEDEQYWTGLNFTIFHDDDIVYSNITPPLPYSPRLAEKGWQKLEIENSKFQALYFTNSNLLFAIAYPSESIATYASKWIEIMLFDSLLVSIIYLLFHLVTISAAIRSPHLEFIINTFARKIFVYLLLIAIIPLFLLFFFLRSYIINERISQSRIAAIDQLQSSNLLIIDFIHFNSENSQNKNPTLNDEIINWVSQTINNDINIYKSFIIEASSRRDLLDTGLLPIVLNGKTYYDLYYGKRPYTIANERIGNLKYQYLASSLKILNQPERIITIPLLFSEKQLNLELAKFYEKILISLALIVALSTILIWVIARRISKPINVLISATHKISDGNFEIKLPQFKDHEFITIKDSFEIMADTLKKSLLNLKQRQEYIEAIIANVTNGVIAVSESGKINLINQAAQNILGLHLENDANLFHEIITINELSAFVEVLEKFNKKSIESQSKEIEISKGNKNYHYKISWIPLTNLFSTQDIIIVIEDLTDVISSNRLSAWADMARRVAHEIKNPLTPMQLAIEHLYKVYKDAPPDFELILEICYKTITKQIIALKQIVNQFSLFGVEKPSTKQPVQLNNFFNSVTEIYKTHLKDKIEFIIELKEPLPQMMWDINKMQKAFTNLIENSIQAIEHKGLISINIYSIQNELTIELSDNGIGMDQTMIQKLFEPYFTTKDLGTGLGLVIAKKFIEEHGGQISVKSALGKGTAIIVKFHYSNEQ